MRALHSLREASGHPCRRALYHEFWAGHSTPGKEQARINTVKMPNALQKTNTKVV